MIARPVSGRPILAKAPPTRRSQARASSSPPPSAAPSMAAMVGMGRFSRSENDDLRPYTKAATSISFIVNLSCKREREREIGEVR